MYTFIYMNYDTPYTTIQRYPNLNFMPFELRKSVFVTPNDCCFMFLHRSTDIPNISYTDLNGIII
ncbi:hypothetical protein Hdeb2414_s0013g00412071 [Helianthus debilis subsp. tardiflorus]